MTTLFQVGIYNYSQNVDRKRFNMTKSKSVESWEDVDHRRHYTVVRERVTGTANLLFKTAGDYNKFVDDIRFAMREDGTHLVTVYVNSTNKVETIIAMLTFKTKTAFTSDAFGRNPAVFSVEVAVEEQ